MFNTLNSPGGGGQPDSKVGQHANVALYTCFAIFGLLVGVIHNKLGPKWSIILGCAPYVFYAGCLLCYNHTKNGERASYVGPLFLYMFYSLNDAAWQTYCYWLMGVLSNDVTVVSRYASLYKCTQSYGAAIAWRINAVGTPS
ncbi:DUF895 domain membrane protein [Podila horticola]|nr:DUF895 domain membrane protein [Podila horticola]